MTERDDPSRVAFGWKGKRRHPLPKSSSGNGADGNGTTTGGEPATPVSAEAAAGFSRLGRLLLDTLKRGVIALDATGAVIGTKSDAGQALRAEEQIRVR